MHSAPQNLKGSRTQYYVSAVHNCKNTRLRECLVE